MKLNHYLRKTALLVAIASALTPQHYAFAEENQFTLEEVIVTAQREETKEIETPAYVNVISQEKLAATGAKTLIEALEFTEGLVTTANGPYGLSVNRTPSSIRIRGVAKGTLVLVNDTPINLGSSFQLDRIPVANIERVEVVKGAAAMLYGSDATGGVINIITKDKVTNSINISYNNLQQKTANLDLQTGKLAFGSFFDQTGRINRISSDETSTATTKASVRSSYTDYYNYAGGTKFGFTTSYVFNDLWSFHAEHTHDNFNREKINATTQQLVANLNDTDTRDFFQLKYNNGGFKVNLYEQFRDANYNTLYSTSYLDSYKQPSDASLGHSKTSSRGFDLQNSWQHNNFHYLAGLNFNNEKYTNNDILRPTNNFGPYSRNQYSAFLQTNFTVGTNTHFTLGMRQQYADMQQIQQSIFLPQLQINHDIDSTHTWFANAGRSFRLPSFYEGYVIGTPATVKPENGWSYEIGYKQRLQKDTLTASLFSIALNDKITSMYQSGKYVSVNYPEFINRGLELNWQHQENEHWNYTLGGILSNPQLKDTNDRWNDTGNKWQITSAVGYKNGAFDAHLSASLLGDRAYGIPNSLPVTLLLNYKNSANQKWTLAVRNLLNRQDVANEMNSANGIRYYVAPRTFQLEHTYQF